jgi:Flp pilus assembly protein TadG
MRVWHLVRATCQRARRFKAEERGNVTLTFALLLIPLLAAVGSAVDYSRANSMRTALQAAVDAAGLMLAKEASGLTASQISQKANVYVTNLFTRPEALNLVVSTTSDTTKGVSLTLIASASIKTAFGGFVGLPFINMKAQANVKTGQTLLRVALVLDNTGSMASDGKMDALKAATKTLLNQLKAAANTNGDIYVSIIPFVKDVNVGGSNYNATWVDWTDWDTKNCYNNDKFNGSPNSYTSQSDCTAHGKYWKVPASHSTWNGCVTDRGNSNAPNADNYDTNVSSPNIANSATLFSAEQYSACPQPVLPLTYDWTAMTNLVDNMSPNGNTNQAIGLVHGWQSLVGGGPYPTPPAKLSGIQYSEIIILMTDGLNTQDRWYTNQLQIDARQQMTCDNVKAAGTTVYTVQVNTSGDPTSTLLQNCASSSDKFYLLTSANQLVTAFQKIGTELSKLRIAQ